MSTTFDWNLEGFAKFWADIEYAEAMREKAWAFYGVDYPEDADDPEDWGDDYDPYDAYDF